MVPLHYDNLHIDVHTCNRQKIFTALEKKTIFSEEKKCDISFFSQTIDCGYIYTLG